MATKQKEQESTDLVPLADEVGDKLVKAFAEASHVAVISETDPKAAMAEIVGRILEATNIEELNAVFSDDAGRNSRDLAESGTPVELRSMSVRTSPALAVGRSHRESTMPWTTSYLCCSAISMERRRRSRAYALIASWHSMRPKRAFL